MERIGVRELRQHASRYLDRVKSGETVKVTERGQLVALLVPPGPAYSARERLVASGRLTPATRPLRLPPHVPVGHAPDTDTDTDTGTGTVLDELREDLL